MKKHVFCVDVFPSEPLDDEQKVEEEVPNGRFIKHFEYDAVDPSTLELNG